MTNDVEELAGPHEQWCHDRAHGDCCGPAECDCGRDERRDAIAEALAEAYGQGRNDGVIHPLAEEASA